MRSLDARLAAYEQGTGHQLIVYIGATTGDAPIEDWAVRALQKWKVGRKGLDDGLVLFIMSQDHKLRIEVGYGLEAVVPDAVASRVINEVMAPRIQGRRSRRRGDGGYRLADRHHWRTGRCALRHAPRPQRSRSH